MPTPRAWPRSGGWSSSRVNCPGLRGIVAFAPLERGAKEVQDHLSALRDIPSVVGVRRLIHDERPGFAVADRFLDGVAALADFELTFDVCVRSSQLDEVIELVRRTPDVQFVLDHVGKPRIGVDPSRWRLQIAELAARRNIVCKLSGLMTEIVSGPTGVEVVEPYLAHALAAYGPDRCLFGSDWPVMTLAATYSIGWTSSSVLCPERTIVGRCWRGQRSGCTGLT